MKDSRDTFYEHLDEVTGFNAGWRAFVENIMAQNDVSNERMFKILKGVKGPEFASDMRRVMKVVGRSRIRISRSATGLRMKDKRWKTIPEIWVDVKSDGEGGMSGYMFIQVKPERFLKIHCSF